MAAQLNRLGVTTKAYHAGLAAGARSAVQEEWYVRTI